MDAHTDNQVGPMILMNAVIVRTKNVHDVIEWCGDYICYRNDNWYSRPTLGICIDCHILGNGIKQYIIIIHRSKL